MMRRIFKTQNLMKTLKHFILTPVLAITLSSAMVSCASGPNAQTGTGVGRAREDATSVVCAPSRRQSEA